MTKISVETPLYIIDSYLLGQMVKVYDDRFGLDWARTDNTFYTVLSVTNVG